MKKIACLALLVLTSACARRPKITSPIEQDQVRPAAEWLKLEPIRLLDDYVRIDTTSEGPGERAGALFLQRIFDCAGISSEIVCPEPGRCNLLARLPGRRREGALLLLNHIDVAPVFASLWHEASPFGGEIKRGYLYGRGSYDMKSLALVQALAMRSLKAQGIVPETDILFLAEADEEVGQRLGSRWLLEHRPEWFQGIGNVLNEGGTAEVVLRDVRFWGLETLQAGYGFLELESRSRESLEALSKRFPRLEGEPVVPHPQVVLSFGMLANHLQHPLTDPLRHLDRVRQNPKELAILPDRYGAFLEPRIHWSGSYAYPPGQTATYRCYAVVSVPPGQSPDPFLDRIAAGVKEEKAEIRERLSSGVTTASPYPTPFTALIERVTRAFAPGVPFGPVPTFGGTTTSIYFRARGYPTYGYSPIPFNITDEVRRHGNDERIFLRDYLRGVELMNQLVTEYAFFPDAISSPHPAQK
jgi:acetylornithine deacetylase/succinyl-diaminopimelate desuccinylase-like protein